MTPKTVDLTDILDRIKDFWLNLVKFNISISLDELSKIFPFGENINFFVSESIVKTVSFL